MKNKFCVKCGSPLEDNMKFCKNCGVPVNSETVNEATGGGLQSIVQKMKTKKWIIISVLGGIIGLCIIFGFFGGNGNIGKSSSMQVKAADMMDDYIRDQASAENKYKDKKVSVTGKLINKNQFNNSQHYAMYIARKAVGERTYDIVVDIPKEQVDAVNKVKVGDFVSAEGDCIGIVKQNDPTRISVQIHSTKINQ